MSLTVLLAICILGCDVLIYFLYEWALGESKPIREHRATSRWQPDARPWTRDEWSEAERRGPAGGTDDRDAPESQRTCRVCGTIPGAGRKIGIPAPGSLLGARETPRLIR
jgi:hypothetical protein